jgi:hypothetical protein
MFAPFPLTQQSAPGSASSSHRLFIEGPHGDDRSNHGKTEETTAVLDQYQDPSPENSQYPRIVLQKTIQKTPEQRKGFIPLTPIYNHGGVN